MLISVKNERPRIDGTKSGFVLLYEKSRNTVVSSANFYYSLAKRAGEPQFRIPDRVGAAEWLDQYKKKIPFLSREQRTLTFASLVEKGPTDGQSPTVNPMGSGRRGVRTLPFSEGVFRMITKCFYTHGSISRVISRADVQTFSSSEVEMGEPDGPTYMANGEPLTKKRAIFNYSCN